jgi:hypothetical protein
MRRQYKRSYQVRISMKEKGTWIFIGWSIRYCKNTLRNDDESGSFELGVQTGVDTSKANGIETIDINLGVDWDSIYWFIMSLLEL